LLTDALVMTAKQPRISTTGRMELRGHDPRKILMMLMLMIDPIPGRFAYFHQLYKHANRSRFCLFTSIEFFGGGGLWGFYGVVPIQAWLTLLLAPSQKARLWPALYNEFSTLLFFDPMVGFFHSRNEHANCNVAKKQITQMIARGR